MMLIIVHVFIGHLHIFIGLISSLAHYWLDCFSWFLFIFLILIPSQMNIWQRFSLILEAEAIARPSNLNTCEYFLESTKFLFLSVFTQNYNTFWQNYLILLMKPKKLMANYSLYYTQDILPLAKRTSFNFVPFSLVKDECCHTWYFPDICLLL
jgi:hypothetical protein